MALTGMKLRRRSSMRSMPVWRAASSTRRSSTKQASGRPAPRYASVGTVLVKVARTSANIAGMRYGPESTAVYTVVGTAAPTVET